MAATSARKTACAEALLKLNCVIVLFAVPEQPMCGSRMTPRVAQGLPLPHGFVASNGPLSPLHQYPSKCGSFSNVRGVKSEKSEL